MKKLFFIVAFTIIIPLVSDVARGNNTQDLERKIDALENDLTRERALQRRQEELRRQEEKRQEEIRRQEEATKDKKRRIENERRRQEFKEIRAHQRRQQRAEQERKSAEEKKRMAEEEEAKFQQLRDMATQHPNSKYSKLYEIEALKRSGEISNRQANTRKNYVLHGPSGGTGVKKGGTITLTEDITDPVMRAKGAKQGDAFIDE
jgi:flagellar biosynthesis GTPase FlhF